MGTVAVYAVAVGAEDGGAEVLVAGRCWCSHRGGEKRGGGGMDGDGLDGWLVGG